MAKQNTLHNFKVMYNNIRGIKSKRTSLKQIVDEENPTIVGIAETNLQEGESVEIEGYRVKRNDREKQGGGVMIMYKECLKNMVTVVNEESEDFEALWIRLSNGKLNSRIGVIYMPQEDKTPIKKVERIYGEIGKEVERAIVNNEQVILMGDFNCKIGRGKKDGEISKGGKILLNMTKKYGLHVVNTNEKCEGKWTRIEGDQKSTLDYIIIREEDKNYVKKMIIDEEKNITPYGKTNDRSKRVVYSDHCMMKCDINLKMKLQEEEKPKYMGVKEYEKYIKEIEKEKISNIINKDQFKESYTKWNDKVIEIANRNKKRRKKISKSKVNRKLTSVKKQIVKKIKNEENEKDKKLLKRRKSLIDEYIDNENKEKRRVKVNKIVEEIKKGGGVDSETFWKVRRRITGGKKEEMYAVEDESGERKEDPEEIKEVFRKYYDNLLNRRAREDQKGENDEVVETVMRGLQMISEKMEPQKITKKTIEEIVHGLKNRKAGDKSGWTNELLKWGGDEMVESLERIYKLVSVKQEIPREWEQMIIKSINKKMPHVKMKNKRGLFLTSIIEKVYEKILKQRNEKDMNAGMSEMQTGGRKGRSTIDNVMVLLAINERNKFLGKDTYHICRC